MLWQVPIYVVGVNHTDYKTTDTVVRRAQGSEHEGIGCFTCSMFDQVFSCQPAWLNSGTAQVSNASCTTNCLAPLTKVIVQGLVHSSVLFALGDA